MSAAQARLSFLSFDSFVAPEHEAPPPAPAGLPARSPFVTVYESADAAAEFEPRREAFAALVDELHDDEFEEALAGLHSHGRAFHDAQLAAGMPREQADRLLTRHFEPLMHESAAMVDAIAQQFVPRESAGIVEHEIESFAEGYLPTQPLDPEFENFFGKLLKKVGRAAGSLAKKAIKGVAQLGLAPVLRLIKTHVMGFLTRAIQRVLGRLPAALQPAARQLAQKLGFPVAAPAAAPAPAAPTAAPDPTAGATDSTTDAVPDTPTPQQELDEQLASAVLAQDSAELEFEQAAGVPQPAVPVYAELEDARERFIQQLDTLKDGESPEPAMQQFLPALMPALTLARKIIGHDRLVGLVSKLLAPLVQRLIGQPAQAAALSRAIADAGLKLLNLELGDDETPRLAAPAVAATVEEAMARVVALPAEVQADPELLEAFALEAFETAAAANLPALFSEATYQQRPELLEGGVDVAWPLMPLARGPRRYKRCSRLFTVRLTPYMAREVESFEGAPLADFVQDEFGGEEPGELEAELYLYEALPGSTLADIARGERETLGPGLSDEANVAQLHPLTPQAAATLLSKPGLGRAWWPQSRHQPLARGQRFYALRLPGMHRHRRPHHRPLHLRMRLDSVRNQVHACVFVSEARAQKLAASLRQPAQAGALAARFDHWVQRRIGHLMFGMARHRLRVVHAGLPPGQPAAAQASRLPGPAARAFAAKLRAWMVAAYAEALRTQAAAIIAATENAADGITLSFTIEKPPGLQALLQTLARPGTPPPLAQPAGAEAAAPRVHVVVSPGHGCA